MRNSSEMAATPIADARQISDRDAELDTLCDKIRTVNGAPAKQLPAQVLSYLAKSLSRIEIDIHVEECLPMVCAAAHAFVRAMGTFSSRHADDAAVEQTRERLIQALETTADEMRLCKPLAPAPRQNFRRPAASISIGTMPPDLSHASGRQVRDAS